MPCGACLACRCRCRWLSVLCGAEVVLRWVTLRATHREKAEMPPPPPCRPPLSPFKVASAHRRTIGPPSLPLHSRTGEAAGVRGLRHGMSDAVRSLPPAHARATARSVMSNPPAHRTAISPTHPQIDVPYTLFVFPPETTPSRAPIMSSELCPVYAPFFGAMVRGHLGGGAEGEERERLTRCGAPLSDAMRRGARRRLYLPVGLHSGVD